MPMIAFVRGRVAAVQVDAAIVDVGGVGLKIACTPGTLAGLRVGDESTLATAMVVREDSLTLFGFADDDERSLFELLQTASGVGPKLAQAMLAVHGPDELRRAVVGEDLTALCQVPGIGRKGAQRIVLELKDRIGVPTGGTLAATPGRAAAVEPDWQPAVRGALLGLGWSTREADVALESVAPIAAEQAASGQLPSTADLLRAALRSLSRA
jgi:holliday junction DNA helicase RuvA